MYIHAMRIKMHVISVVTNCAHTPIIFIIGVHTLEVKERLTCNDTNKIIYKQDIILVGVLRWLLQVEECGCCHYLNVLALQHLQLFVTHKPLVPQNPAVGGIL